jgi:hypothetical protein
MPSKRSQVVKLRVNVQITRDVYDQLLRDCPDVPPEVGGILGGHGDVVSTFALDAPGNPDANNQYAPDTGRLNSIISGWADRGVDFYGIFHTHFPYGYYLSPEDEVYIRQILSAMPGRIRRNGLVLGGCEVVELDSVGDVDGAGFVGFSASEGGGFPGCAGCLASGALADEEPAMGDLHEEDRDKEVKVVWGEKPP